MGKDIVPTTAKTMAQHGNSSIVVKEMLYRSQESRRLTAAYRMIQELRKRFRQYTAKAADEADLVAQETLVHLATEALRPLPTETSLHIQTRLRCTTNAFHE